MATTDFAKIALVFLLTSGTITAAPIPRFVNGGSDVNQLSATNLFGGGRFEHHLAKRSTEPSDQSIPSRFRDGSMAALHETGKILQTAAMLPAEALQLVRLLTVPVLDATLSLPANVLEGAATMSSKGFEGARASARSSADGLLHFLASVKQFKQSLLPHIGISKDFSLGPLSFHKTFEFGSPKKVAPPPPAPEVYTTPAPVPDVPKVNAVVPPPALTTESPAVIVASPAPPAVTPAPVAPVTTPAPVAIVQPVPVPVVVAPPAVVDNQVQVVNVINGDTKSEKPDALPAIAAAVAAAVTVTTPPPVLVPAVPVAPVPVAVVPAPVAVVPAPVAVVPAPVAVVPAPVAPPTISDGDQTQVATVVKN